MAAELASNSRDVIPANIGGDETPEVQTSRVPFWKRSTTRRIAFEVTGLGVAGGAVVGSGIYTRGKVLGLLDAYIQDELSTLSEEGSPSDRVLNTLDMMRNPDQLSVPALIDPFYGIGFPSNGDIANRLLEGIKDNEVVFVEEARPSFILSRFGGLVSKSSQNRGVYTIETTPENEPDRVILPSDFRTSTPAERAVRLSALGFNKYYNPPKSLQGDPLVEDKMFHLYEQMLTYHYMEDPQGPGQIIRWARYDNLYQAYRKALLENKPKVWDDALKVYLGVPVKG